MSEHHLPLPGPHAGLRIGLFGGSFNPAHEGHLHVAETALKRLQLDWIWWIVARGNPLKTDHGEFAARLASANAAIDWHPRMIATDFEMKLGTSYTCETLGALLSRCPDTDFVWLMGGDSLAGFHKWKKWKTITESVPIGVVARPDTSQSARASKFARTYHWAHLPEAMAPALAGFDAPAWTYLTAPLNAVSSTALRACK